MHTHTARTRMKRIRPHLLADDAGQAMVEFAFVLPILLIVVLGIVDFGRAWNAHQVITDAAREGARTMVVAAVPEATDASVKQVVKDALTRAGLKATPTITLTGARWQPGQGTGTLATVKVEYPYTFTFLGPMIKWTTSQSSIMLRTSFVMRNE